MIRPTRLMVAGPLLVLLAGVAGAQPRYRDQEDGTVKDAKSGLIWLAHADCWGPMPWERAKAEVAKLRDGICGLTDGSKPGDWRLPTRKEWEVMVVCSCDKITLSDDSGTGCYSSGASTFHDVQAKNYWSATESGRGGAIWVMSLLEGIVDDSGSGASLHVWPVRH